MIGVILRDLRWRYMLVAVIAFLIYLIEPAFHQHGAVAASDDPSMSPIGVSASLAYLAALTMIVLLAGFISSDRREGYSAIYFSQPTRPLSLYALHWGIAYISAICVAALFLVIGQVVAWGSITGGWSGLLMPALTALAYGGLMAFFSVTLPRGDAWVVAVMFLPTLLPLALIPLEAGLPPLAYTALIRILPPQFSLQEVYRGLLLGGQIWDAAAYVVAYGLVWLGAAGLMLTRRPPVGS